MPKISIKPNTKGARKFIKGVVTKDIQTATRMAMNRAGASSVTEASKRISKKSKVPRKYLKSRFGRSRYSKKSRSVNIYFRFLDINPAGTKKHPVALSSVSSFTKKGKKTKYHGQLKAIGGYYKGVIVHRQNYAIPMILKPVDTGGNIQVKIKLGGWATKAAKAAVRDVAPKVFKTRFRHELSRRVKRRASR